MKYVMRKVLCFVGLHNWGVYADRCYLSGLCVLLLVLVGCADAGAAIGHTLFTSSGALAPKAAEIVAASTAAATLTKSAVDGVSAIEEFKAMMQGKSPKKAGGLTSNANIIQSALVATDKEKTK